MNSKILIIAFVSIFFQGVMTVPVTVVPTAEKPVVNGSTEIIIKDVHNGSLKTEDTKVSNTTDLGVRIEYTTKNSTQTTVTVPSVTPTNGPSTSTVAPSSSSTTTNATESTSTSTTTTTTTTTTIKPSTGSSSTSTSTNPTTVKPEPVPTVTTETSVKAPSSTPAAVVQRGSFDAPNFIGGIVLTLGLTAIGFVAYKFYKARKAEGNYRTL